MDQYIKRKHIWDGSYLNPFFESETSFPKFTLEFGEINEQNIIPVVGNGESYEGLYNIKGSY